MSFTRLEPSGVNTSANFTFANVTVNGNVTSGNANLGNAATANYFIGNGALLTGISGTYSNADVANYLPTYTGNVSANYFLGNGALLTGIAGTYSNADVANYLPTYTGNVSANYIFGNGSGLTSLNGANVTGQVPNSLISGTVYEAAQPNITSVGILSNVSILGSGNVSNLLVSNFVLGNLIPNANVTYNLGNNDYRWNDLYLAGNSIIIGGAQIQASGADIALTGNVESGNANLGNLAVANYFSGNGSLLSSITGGNVVGQVGNALVSGTVYTAAQPNITSVGTLTSLNVSINANTTDLNVSGNATVAGNLTVNGNVTYINVESLVIEDPIIEMGGGPNGNALTTNDGKDRGEILHYYTTAPVDAFMGWDNSNGEFAFGSNVSVASEVVTFNSFGNVRAGYFIGNGSALSSITGANVTGQVANALVAGTVYTNAQPNITSLGTLANLSVTSNVSAGNVLTNNLLYANGVAWSFGATYSNTNVAAYLPTYTGNVAAGNVLTDNLLYANGSPYSFGSTYSNANVANYLPTYTGNVAAGNVLTNNLLYANGVAWSFGATYSNTNVAAYLPTYTGNVAASYFIGNGSALTSITGGNVTGQVSNALVAGTVYTAAQPNITSVGTLSSLTVTGLIIATANGIRAANIYDSTGTLTVETRYGNKAGDAGIYGNLTVGTSGTGNITAYNANLGNLVIGNFLQGTLTTGAQPNITSVGTLSSLSVTANVSAGNILTNNLLYANGVAWSFGSSYSNTNVAAYLPTYTGNVAANYFIGNGSTLTSITGANVTGQVANALVAGTVYTNAQPNITSLGTLSSLTVTGNVSSGNSNLGNLTVSNFFSGNGSLLTSITGSNIAGQVGNALVAGTVYTNAQPNITSVGTLSSLTVTANVIAGNANLGNLATANFFSGNGSLLTSITGANVTGQVANALVAGTVYTAAQPNITSLGILSSLTVTANISAGNANISGNIVATNGTLTGALLLGSGSGGNISGANVVTANLFTGTLTTGAQPNITSVGTLTILTVTGNISSGNANLGNLATANFLSGNGSLLSSITGGNVTGQVANSLVAGTIYTNAQPNITSLGTLSSLNVTGNVSSGNSNLGNLAIANFFSGNGSLLSSITGGNVNGQVANALVASTVYTNAQPNITSLGTLSSLSVTANVSAGNVLTNNLLYANGVAWSFGTTYSNTNVAAYLPTYTGNVAANYFIGNGSLLTNITGSNVTGQVGNALVSGTVYTAAQPNITSVGTLSSLAISGNANVSTDLNVTGNTIITGNLTVQGNTSYINVETLRVEDPIIELGGGPNGNPLTTNDGKDRGTLLHYYTTAPVDAFMGWDNSNGEFAFGSNVSVTNEVVTFNSLGNVRASYIIANGSLLTSITGANITGQVGNALIAGTVYTNAQPNITSLGTLSSLSVTANVSAGNILSDNLLYANGVSWSFGSSYSNTNVAAYLPTYTGNVAAGNILTNNLLYANGVAWSFGTTYSNTNVAAYLPTYTGNVAANYFIGNGSALTSITGGNVSGQVGNALVAGTVYTNAQPNITSLGTLSSLSVTANVSAGNVLTNNLLYANGVAWSFGSTYSNTNVAAYLPTYTGNVTAGNVLTNNLLYSNGVAWSFGSSYSNTNVAAYLPTYTGNVAANYFIGNGSTLTSITGSNVSGQVGNALVAGTVYTNAQPNITSVGTLTSLNVTGNISSGNANLGNAVTANFFVGNGSLLTGISASVSSISNGTSNINIGSSGGNITAGVGGTSNVLILTSTGANVTGYANVSANFSAGNATVAGTLTMGSGSGGNLTGANVISANLFTGTLTTGTQPNITSIGTLSSLTVTGLIIATSNGIRTANIFDSTGTVTIETRYGNRAGDAGIYGNLTVGTSGTGNITSYNANLGNLVIGNFLQGTLITGAQPNITSIGTLQSTTIAANSNITLSGSLAQITGANLVSASLLTGALTTAAQPNITSVGTLQSTTIAANSNVTLSGSLSQITGANLVSASLLTGTLTTAAQPNITTVGTLSSLSVTANVSAGNVLTNNLLYANGVAWNFGSSYSNTNVAAYLPTYTGNLTAGNISGANLISGNFLTGTLTTAAQPNITSVGSLTSLTVSGDASVTGFITSQEFTEVTQSLTGATGTVTHNVAGGLIFVHTSVAASFTANFTNVPTTDNRSIVVTIVITQGATGFIPNAVQINSVAQTINWPGGVTPTGNANKRDVFTFALLRVSGAWTVLGNNGTFG